MITDGRSHRRTDGRTPGSSSLYPANLLVGDNKQITPILHLLHAQPAFASPYLLFPCYSCSDQIGS